MPRSSKKKTCFSRKGVRNTLRRAIRKAIQTRRRKLRKQKGGNYTTDATVTRFDGQEIKAPHTIVVATSDGKVMSASAFQRSQESLSKEAY